MPASRPIFITNRFLKTWKHLPEKHRQRVIDIIIALPDLLCNPHQHSGFGFRNLRGTLFHEARIDLRWRLIMRVDESEIVLFDVMNHDQVGRL